MTIFELFMVNDDWSKDTDLRILNRDKTIYKNTTMSKMSEHDSSLEIIGFSKNEITVKRKPYN